LNNVRLAKQKLVWHICVCSEAACKEDSTSKYEAGVTDQVLPEEMSEQLLFY